MLLTGYFHSQIRHELIRETRFSEVTTVAGAVCRASVPPPMYTVLWLATVIDESLGFFFLLMSVFGTAKLGRDFNRSFGRFLDNG